VSPSGTLGTGIDECENGVWVSAYTCTCQVTSSIGGVKHPSECFDVDAPNTARCEYGMDYCAQWDPTDGRHTL
jgi:hypothetical protein